MPDPLEVPAPVPFWHHVGVPGTVLEIGPHLDLTDAEPLIVGAFMAQRRRLLRAARELRDDEWTHPSRCAEWNARELVVHVLGATDACRTTLTGEHSVFAGGFDPSRSPDTFVQTRVADPPSAILRELAIAIDRCGTAIETVRVQDPELRVTAVWGESVDWRLFVTHMFWDSWLHERDLLEPLGREVEIVDDEARLAAAYGLHCAGIMLGVLGRPLEITLALDGPGSATFRAVAEGTDVRISVAELDDRPVNGSVVAVTDVLAGRGDGLGAVLDAPEETVEALAQVGAFLQGRLAPPATG